MTDGDEPQREQPASTQKPVRLVFPREMNSQAILAELKKIARENIARRKAEQDREHSDEED